MSDVKVPMKNIASPEDPDVLCGRGGGSLSSNHPGNDVYKRLIKDNWGVYVTLVRREKNLLIESIVKSIRSRGGRFLAKDSKTGLWFDIGDTRATSKTARAFQNYQNRTPVNSASATAASACSSSEMPPPAARVYPELRELQRAASETTVGTSNRDHDTLEPASIPLRPNVTMSYVDHMSMDDIVVNEMQRNSYGGGMNHYTEQLRDQYTMPPGAASSNSNLSMDISLKSLGTLHSVGTLRTYEGSAVGDTSSSQFSNSMNSKSMAASRSVASHSNNKPASQASAYNIKNNDHFLSSELTGGSTYNGATDVEYSTTMPPPPSNHNSHHLYYNNMDMQDKSISNMSNAMSIATTADGSQRDLGDFLYDAFAESIEKLHISTDNERSKRRMS